MYYDISKLISYNGLLNFVIGERGCGKTFSAKKFVLEDFIKNENEFVYLRRYKTELDDSLDTFWRDLQDNGFYDDLELTVKKSKALSKLKCDGKVCGYAMPLSTSNILKSTAFPKVKTIIFDEFMLDYAAGTYHYLRKEVEMLLDVVETIGRLRDIRVIFLGNNISTSCPYFDYFKIDLPYNSDFKTYKDGLIVVNYVRNFEYRKAKRDSRFGRLIDGTTYGEYAIDNKSLRDNSHFIEKRPQGSTYSSTLIINGNHYGVWDGHNGFLYISTKYDPSSKFKFACTMDDHTEDTIFTGFKNHIWLKYILTAYRNSRLMFESQKVKNGCVHLLNKSIAK